MKAQLNIACLFSALIAVLNPKAAAVIPGGEIVVPTGGTLSGDFLITTPLQAAFTSDYLFGSRRLPDPFIPAGILPVGIDTTIGGPFSFVNSSGSPVEAIFGIFVRNSSNTYYTGPESRNPDGVIHATVDLLGPGDALIGFEDFFGGGDFDYNDAQVHIKGDFTVVATPDHSTNALPLGLAALAIFGYMTRQRVGAVLPD